MPISMKLPITNHYESGFSVLTSADYKNTTNLSIRKVKCDKTKLSERSVAIPRAIVPRDFNPVGALALRDI